MTYKPLSEFVIITIILIAQFRNPILLKTTNDGSKTGAANLTP